MNESEQAWPGGHALWLLGALALLACDRSEPTPAKDAPAPAASLAPARPEPPQSPSEKQAPPPLEPGDAAPDVTLTLQDGKTLELSSLRGQPVVVFFYPKDDTPGCTTEATGIRDDYAAFQKAGVRVLGVSTQDAASHRAFIDKYELPFDLVVDSGGEVARAFRVPLRGEVASRQTFLIDGEGKLKKTWLSVDPSTHAEELLSAIAE